jgi:hypothetical protein
MKVVKFFSVVLVSSFLTVSGLLANNVEGTNAEVKNAENAIREQVAGVLSDVNAAGNSVVYVVFTVSATKGFEVVSVNGSDADLASEVKSVLSSKAISTSALLDGKYLVKVRFADYK